MSHIIENIFYSTYPVEWIHQKEQIQEIKELEKILLEEIPDEKNQKLLQELIDEYDFFRIKMMRMAYHNGFQTGARLINEVNDNT